MFAAAPGAMLPLGEDEVVWRLRTDGSHHVMTRQVFAALSHCGGFAPLAQHAAQIASALPELAGQQAAILRVLDHLVARRLLLSAGDWLDGLRGGDRLAPASLRAVFVAIERPDAGALIESLAAAEETHRAAHRYVLLGGGADASGVRVGEAARRLRATGAPVVWLDAQRQNAIVNRLLRAVPEAASSAKLLFGGTSGSNRNFAGLLAAGQAGLFFEAGLPLQAAPQSRDGIELRGGAWPLRFYASAQDALRGGTEVDGDPIARLTTDCGVSLASLLSNEGPFALTEHDLLGLQPAAVPHLAATTRVAAVVVGNRGAFRPTGAEWLFDVSAGSRERLFVDRDLYLRTLEQPHVWSGPERAQLLARCLEPVQAFDATRLLPPWLPDSEGAAALFGLMLHTIRPNDVVLALPWSLAVAAELPAASGIANWTAETPGLGSLLTDFLAPRGAGLRAATPEARLAALSAALADIAAASTADQVDLLQEYLGFCRADRVARLQAALAAAPTAPVYWQADLRALVEANGRALTGLLPPRLADWPDGIDHAACAGRLARDVGLFAQALHVWPALWAFALEHGASLIDA